MTFNKQAVMNLAIEIDNLTYDYDTYEYYDNVAPEAENREANIQSIYQQIINHDVDDIENYLSDFLENKEYKETICNILEKLETYKEKVYGIYVKQPNEDMTLNYTNKPSVLTASKEYIYRTGSLYFVYLNEEKTLLLGSDGNSIKKKLPLNFLVETNNHEIEEVKGTAVFIKLKQANDSQITNFTNEDRKIIENLLSISFQKELSEDYWNNLDISNHQSLER